MSPVAKAPPLDETNPWPGLPPYTETARELFHGRDREADNLLRLVRRSSFSLLYGKPGMGKSSLVMAGLSPLLRAEDLLPVYVDFDYGAHAPPPAEQLMLALRKEVESQKVDVRPPAAGERLWSYLHHRETDFWSPRHHLLTPVFVLDQFEEIFTPLARQHRSEAEISRLIADLGDLIERRIPAAVLEDLERHPEDVDLYFLQKQTCRFLVCMREDYLPFLDQLVRDMRVALPERTRLEPMTGSQAYEAVARAGRRVVKPEVARRIVALAAGADGQEDGRGRPVEELEVEPTLLSVMCSELNAERESRGREFIDADLLEGRGQEILRSFYQRSLKDQTEAVRNFIEDELVTETGLRDSFPLQEALRRPGITQEAVATLIDRHLLRLEERFGIPRLELTHDVLAPFAEESRKERWRRAERRKLLRWVKLAGLAAVVCAGVAVGFLVLWGKAEYQTVLALQAQERADSLAGEARREAEAARLKEINNLRLYENLDLYKRRTFRQRSALDSLVTDLERRLSASDQSLKKARGEAIAASNALIVYTLSLRAAVEGAQSPEAQKALLDLQTTIDTRLRESGVAPPAQE